MSALAWGVVYPVEFSDYAGEADADPIRIIARCPQVSGAQAIGDSKAEALAALVAQLPAALAALHEAGMAMPLPGLVREGQPALYAPVVWHG